MDNIDTASDLAKFETLKVQVSSFVQKHEARIEHLKGQLIENINENLFVESMTATTVELRSSKNILFHLESIEREVSRDREDGQAQNRLDRIKDMFTRTMLENMPEVTDDDAKTQMKRDLFVVLGQLRLGPIQR